MITTFRTTTSGLTAQPSTEKLVVRSSSAADTTQTLTTSGTVSSAADTDTFTLIGQREVLGTKTFTALMSATLSAACAGTVSVLKTGTPAEGSIVVTTNPANNNTVTIAVGTFTQVYTFKTALTGAANEVLIGAAAANTALNLSYAINDTSANEGTLYGTGTAANAFCTATISSATVTLRDKVPCKRGLAWGLTQVGTGLALTPPTGGLDGIPLTTLTTGVVQKYGVVALDDEALVLGLLPPQVTWVSEWVKVGGSRCALYMSASNVTTAITGSYETATSTSYPMSPVSLTALDNNDYILTPAENVEFIRLTLVNTNSTAASVNAKIVSG